MLINSFSRGRFYKENFFIPLSYEIKFLYVCTEFFGKSDGYSLGFLMISSFKLFHKNSKYAYLLYEGHSKLIHHWDFTDFAMITSIFKKIL